MLRSVVIFAGAGGQSIGFEPPVVRLADEVRRTPIMPVPGKVRGTAIRIGDRLVRPPGRRVWS